MTRLTRIEIAAFLTGKGFPIAPSTLAKRAVAGTGPPFDIWNGKAMYDDQVALDWAMSGLKPTRHSTAKKHAPKVPQNTCEPQSKGTPEGAASPTAAVPEIGHASRQEKRNGRWSDANLT